MSSLGKDLAAVRKHQERTLDEVFEKTRIPVHILHSIEDDSIFSDFDENKTYIRSFVRSYAKALKINNEVIVEALNQEEQGTYDGLIAQRHESGTLQKSVAEQTSEVEPSDVDSSEAPTPSDKKGDETPDIPKRDKEHGKVPPEQMTGGRSTSYSQKDSPTKVGTTNTATDTPINVNWADMGKKFTQLDGTRPIWIVVVIAIIVVVAGGGYWMFTGDNAQTTTTTSDSVSAADTTESELSDTVTLPDSLKQDVIADSDTTMVDETVAEPESDTTSNVLPDTLELLIYAAYEKLEPVRVLSDVNDRLSPYWIEHEEAMRFDFVDSIRIRGQYNRMLLLYNGHQVMDHLGRFYDRDQRFLILQRELFEDPKWFEPAPDTLPAGVPQPQVIRQRPKF